MGTDIQATAVRDSYRRLADSITTPKEQERA
jgi:hypothetical protein